jgi:hypothetical protein
MVATLEQLYQALGDLQKKTAELTHDFRQVLAEYLKVLGQSTEKQLILSGFHLCTQVYPETFLQRSVSEREALQRNIRQLGQQLVGSLSHVQQPLQELEFQDKLDPTVLLELWETIEDEMVEQIRCGSRQLNQLLQDAHVMEIKSLDKLLEMAEKAEEQGRTVTNPPHLLKALIDPKESNDDDLDPVVAVYLQIGDLEFTNPELMGWRQKLRPILQKLSQLQQAHAQKEEEKLTAEAIAAWKSTWIAEGSPFNGQID